REFRLQSGTRLVVANESYENAATAKRGDVARDVAGAADIGFTALCGDHGRRRFRRNPRHLAIDELVEHEIADAEHRLLRNRVHEGVKIEHVDPSGSSGPSAEAIVGVEEVPDVERDRSTLLCVKYW